MTTFLHGKPPTKAADAEGAAYPFCSSVLCKLGLWGESSDRNAVFKRDTETAVPTYVLLLKILQQSSKDKDFVLCKYTVNHGIIPMYICVSSVGIKVTTTGNKKHGTLLAELKEKTCTVISHQFSSSSDHPLTAKM